jgi:hypothetical protein
LVYPYGQLGIDAERLVLKSLSNNASAVGLPNVEYKDRRFSMLNCENKNQRKTIRTHLKAGIIVVWNVVW